MAQIQSLPARDVRVGDRILLKGFELGRGGRYCEVVKKTTDGVGNVTFAVSSPIDGHTIHCGSHENRKWAVES